jgi:hypothetical protein
MAPIKPSPRRPEVGFGCFQRAPPRDNTTGKQLSQSFSTPLYYNNMEGHNANGVKKPHVVLITNKEGSPLRLSPSASTFKPVISQYERPVPSSFKRYTPPVSHFCHRVIPSPSPSLTSVTTSSETTVTSGSMTPCMTPSPTFSHSPSPYRYYDSRASTPTLKSPGYMTPTHQGSPTKRRTLLNNSPAEDSTRKQRIKTELCTHFARERFCPFGDRCTYAHGEEELQMTNLMDLHRAGLVEDVETYRTKPCWTWVATGSW